METKETSLKTLESKTILEDNEYFKYIFKKTEKIVCAIFYVVHADFNIGQKDLIVTKLEEIALRTLELSLQSLKDNISSIPTSAESIKFALIELESKLRVVAAAHIIGNELLDVFVHEIDSVQRSLRHYTTGTSTNPLFQPENSERPFAYTPRTLRQKVSVPKVSGSHDGSVSKEVSRRDKVLAVIKDKTEATIKDIVEQVTDCSEKTIQRELIAMIKDGIIVREGERRWSKYKLV